MIKLISGEEEMNIATGKISNSDNIIDINIYIYIYIYTRTLIFYIYIYIAEIKWATWAIFSPIASQLVASLLSVRMISFDRAAKICFGIEQEKFDGRMLGVFPEVVHIM